MGPYSHYYLAAQLEPSLKPENRPAYFWGAVVPDIRYLARMRREQTHLPPEQIKALMACHPQLRSFLLGYQVHLLTDQIDVLEVVGAAFPLNLLQKLTRKHISHPQMTMLVEMYYLQAGPVKEPLSGAHNSVLADLGVSAEQAEMYHQALRGYFESRSAEAAIAAFQQIGLIENSRVQKYMAAYQSMQKQKALNGLLVLSIKNARLDSKVLKHVRAHLAD